MKEKTAHYINILGEFCGKRDIEKLTTDCLQVKYGIKQADVMALFGGSILHGGDVLANAMKQHIAKKYIIVGGEGHTTETLRQQVHKEYPFIITEGLSEAEIFNGYLRTVYGLEADYLETESTNCGNNITYLLALLEEKDIRFRSIILCQDASMQYRMEAVLRKYVSDSITVINYAAYKAKVVAKNNMLVYSSDIPGMWDISRYVDLLMGEIPRLEDDCNGYGPLGKNFIVHVDIPENVKNAFEELKKIYGCHIREANPLYASNGDKAGQKEGAAFSK